MDPKVVNYIFVPQCHEIKIVCDKDLVPIKAHEDDSGYDLKAAKDIVVHVQRIVIVETSVHIEFPFSEDFIFEGQVRPRSGLAAKYGITVLNSAGTIDNSYRGEIKVILINHGTDMFNIKRGDRIAQLVIATIPRTKLCEVSTLSDTIRGSGGFGSTGK